MKRFAEVLILAAFLVPCAFMLDHGHGYAWRGKGSDTSWETCANWLMTCSPPCPPVPCYPSNTHDTATIPYKAGGWGNITLTTDRSIGDLTLRGSATFISSSGNKILQVKNLILEAPAAASVTITANSASLNTDGIE